MAMRSSRTDSRLCIVQFKVDDNFMHVHNLPSSSTCLISVNLLKILTMSLFFFINRVFAIFFFLILASKYVCFLRSVPSTLYFL